MTATHKIGVLMSDGQTQVFDIDSPYEDVLVHRSGALSIRSGGEMHTFAPAWWRRVRTVPSDKRPEQFFGGENA